MQKFNHLLFQCMKISLVQFIIACVFMGMTYAKDVDAQELLNQRVTLQISDMRIKNVLAEIEKNAHVKFSYSPQIIQSNRKINVEIKNNTLDEVLKKVLLPLNIHYKVAGNQIILIKITSKLEPSASIQTSKNESSPNVASQLQAITGKVTDEKGAGLVGVSVTVKGTNKGTTTDAQGIYGIEADENSTLVFSYIGFSKKEIKAGSQSTINVSLKEDASSLEEVVVTGVFDARTRLEASSAISILKTKDIERVAATSAGDFLKNIAGVYVNAGRGEIGNQVATRGLSVYPSLQGYQYISMQEDGLPITSLNYGTDYYLRPDATTNRIEVLRGGAAAVTAANAPGGVFNYISKTGGENMASEVRAKFGLEGNGKNPYYRVDFNTGGPLSKDKSVRFNVGGFYRQSDGARYSGYSFNNGGQLKANIIKNYAKGSIKVYTKYLNDRNGLTDFTPTQNWANPTLPAGYSYTDSYGMPSIQMQVPRNGTMVDFDSKNKYHVKEFNIGTTWNHDLGNGFKVNYNGKYSNKTFFQQNTQIVSVSDPTAAFFYILPGLGGGGPNARYGVYTLTDLVTNQVLGTFTRPTSGPVVAGDNNNFPGVNNRVLFMPLFMTERNAKENIHQLGLSKQLKNMTFNVGGYYSKITQNSTGVNTGSGPGAATIQDQPHMIGISLAATDGKTYQVTNPQGFMKIDEGGQAQAYVNQATTALFFGHNWNITPKLNLDWGLRHENVKNIGWNSIGVPINTTDSRTFGGLDNNPLTLYDNFGGTSGTPVNYNYISKYTNFSAGLNFKLTENQALSARISQGRKSPDVSTLYTLTSQFNVNNTPVSQLIQKIEQYEFSYKLTTSKYKLFITPFVSKLSNFANLAYFRNVDNTPYTPALQFAQFYTKGVELEGEATLSKVFSVNASATFQNSKAQKYTAWIANANGPQDDVLLDFSGNKTGSVPPVMFNLAPKITLDKFYGILSYNHLSKRPANTANGWDMPGFDNIDLSTGYAASKRLSFQFNVNNLLNKYGIMEWLAPGNFPTNTNRDAITKTFVAANPNSLYTALRNMPRSFFLTASFKF
jgi:iron complex outermembrane recepter protein